MWVHAALALGLGLAVGHIRVELLMARARVKGFPGNRRSWPRHENPTATDLVERMLTREARNRLWVIDIAGNRTYEVKVYCMVVLDTFSRRVVGWSIDSSQPAVLITNALGMAIANRPIHFLGLHRPRQGRPWCPRSATVMTAR